MFAAGKSSRTASGGGSPSGPPDPYFSGVTLLLDGEGTNGLQNNTFRDDANNTITRNGNITQGSFSPFRPSNGAYSVSVNSGSSYAEGQGNYLQASGGVTFTGDYTIEGWFFQTGFGSNPYINVFAGGSTQIYFEGDGTGGKRFGAVGMYNGSAVTSSADVVPKWQWNHVVWQRSGSTTTIYVNGTSVVTSTSISGTIGANYIGAYSNGNYQYQGYMSNIRMSNIARYSGNFTSPTTPFTIDGSTTLLLKFEAAEIIDKSMRNNIQTVGNAQISSSVKKYGSSRIYIPGAAGAGHSLKAARTPDDFNLPGDFTVEFWAYPVSWSQYSPVLETRQADDTSSGLYVMLFNDGWTLYPFAQGPAATINTWQHIAFVRSGNTLYGFKDGTLFQTISCTTSTYTYSGTGILSLGYAVGDTGFSRFFNGYIDDLRITKGYARYTSSFTPPTVALTSTYLDPKPATDINYLIVAGGGGGGGGVGGAGGAGGVLSGNTALSSGTTYNITVGAAGTGASGYGSGSAGGNSTFNGLTAYGGGTGGGYSPGANGGDGGSGGGGGSYSGPFVGGSGTTGQGNAGGAGAGSGIGYAGGGGGANQKGGDATSSKAGDGGHGKFYYITGIPAYYGGGGGGSGGYGAQDTGLPAFGGAGGGGQGGSDTPPGTFGFNGVPYTGGGGGGARDYAPGGNGGSGVVILSIPTSRYTGTTSGSPTVTTVGTNKVLKFTSNGSYTA